MTSVPKLGEIIEILCKHCNKMYFNTKDNFYTKKGKIQIDICKKCKCNKSKLDNIKTPRDRTAYSKAYYLKKLKKKVSLD